ncbi:beta-xylosidase [Granulicella mallensis]|uniref:Beta-xylosidase n=1 Tax=Granulicella mallensis TaxID=940614 RepID=A0A7W8EBX1_9BACT|nr:glycoside hydrolase 43 family protein [Granulicella mallensis]MBB5066287.1 beta-xylosidase [Granulicella mallensis]
MPNLSSPQLSALSFAILFACSSTAALPKLQSKAGDVEPASAMAGRLGHFGDQRNGTYLNPILPADFQNTDVLRVGSHYYYISATKAMSPGMAVLTSDDLMDWKIIGHVIPDITQFSPRFNYDHMDGAQRGVWAGTLAYHAGLFYVYFTTPDEGIFVSTAANPAGPWSPLTCLMKAAGWDDPAPLWDDDGKAYLITTNFAVDPKNGKPYNIHLFRMSSDGLSIELETDKIIYQSRCSEANKLYKFNGLYYHFFSEVTKEGRVPMIGRAKTIAGPYEIHQLNHVNARTDREPNQGSILQTHTGKWVFITHHGLNEWEGRPASILPVTWIDGWPVAGEIGQDGIGNMVWSGKEPIPVMPRSSIHPALFQTTDDFNAALLSPKWEWFFQPKPDAWSLTERPGYLRLHALRPLDQENHLLKSPDILTQRPFRVNNNVAVVKIDIGHMVDGQKSGLCFLGRTYASMDVIRKDGKSSFSFDNNGQAIHGPGLPADKKQSGSKQNGVQQVRHNFHSALTANALYLLERLSILRASVASLEREWDFIQRMI